MRVNTPKVPVIAVDDARAILVCRRKINQCAILEATAREHRLFTIATAAIEEQRTIVKEFWAIADRYRLAPFSVGEIVAAAELDARGEPRE